MVFHKNVHTSEYFTEKMIFNIEYVLSDNDSCKRRQRSCRVHKATLQATCALQKTLSTYAI